MQYCEHCGSEIPVRSHFCGSCGLLLGDRTKDAADITRPSQPNLPSLPVQETPPLFSQPSYPPLEGARFEQSDAEATIRHEWSGLEEGQQEGQQGQQFRPFQPFQSSELLQQSGEQQEDEEERAVFPEVLLPFTPLGYGQLPGGTVPAVQGTPQIGGVPSVQGTPSTGIPAESAGASPAHGLAHHGAMSAPQHTWTWEQPQHHVEHAQSTPPHTQPRPPEHHSGPDHGHQEHHQHHHVRHQQHAKLPHTHRIHLPRVPKAGAATTKLAAGAATKWGIVMLTAVAVLVASGVLLVLANPPALSLSGASTVTSGNTLHIHGKGFVPGGSINLTLDNGQHVAVIGTQATAARGIGAGPAVADASQLLNTAQSETQAASNSTVTVSITGTFDANINVLTSWSAGKHVIHATESLGSRSANLSFTILSISARLVVNPSILDFGTVQTGAKVANSVLIGNTGGSQLNWSATTDGSKWLRLGSSVGVVDPSGAQEPLDVTVDASLLKIGDYTASIQIHSKEGGDAQVAVKVHVGPASKVKQAQLSVNPTKLDFGKLPAGQQVFDNITIANQGTAALKWQADTGTASWLTLSTTSGNVPAGGLPDTVQVIADSSNRGLQPGLNSATITIKWNGQTTTIPVTLTLNSSGQVPGSPTPTLSPTPPPPLLAVSPGGFAAPGDANCHYSAGSGWTCTAILSSPANAQSNLSWTATSSGVSGVSFSPSSGVLTPGQQNMPVSIAIPNTVCPASATFTFKGPANSVPIAWGCAAPTLNVSPTTLNANTDCQFNNGWACSVSLSTGASDEGQLNWTTSSGGIGGIAFTPSGGTLTAGQQPTHVSITVPNSTCPANASMTFAGQGSNSATVSWSCSPPQINVSPTSLNQTSSGCTQNSDGTYNCTVTVSEASAGTLNWTASSSNGGSVNPAGGQLTPGQASQTVTLTSIPCQSDSFTFQGQGSNSVAVSWSCSQAKITVAPGSIAPNSGGCTQNSDGTYTCTVTVGETAPGNLNWSAPSGIGGTNITFSPSSGQLSANQPQQQVTIASIPCANNSFTFTDQSNNTATVNWSCTPPPPTLTVTPTSLNASGCTQNTDGTYTCTVTVGETPAGTLNWSSNSGVGGTINPAGGQLTPGQSSQQVTLQSIVCQNGTITFSGQGSNTVTVAWSCTPPPPPTLTVTVGGNCPADGKGNYVCTDTLQETGGPGTVNWTASAENDLPGTNLPQTGSLPTGQSTQVTVIIPISDCPSGGSGVAGHYDYTWSGGSFRVTFSCNPASISSPQNIQSSSFAPSFATLTSVADFAVNDRRTEGRRGNRAA